MPGMPRIPGKGKDIAYKILGVPDNMKKQKRVNRKRQKRVEIEESKRIGSY